MRFAVLSDVHGNLPALESMLDDAGRVDGYVCLGDMVNYGPWSDECVRLIRSLPNLTVVAGNHEEAFLTGRYRGTNPVARTFFEFCYPTFTARDEISDLPSSLTTLGFRVQHTFEDRYVYPDSDVLLDANWFIGHSHHQFVLQDAGFVLINPGSVGQNRKYIDITNYLIVEFPGESWDSLTIEPRAIRHDIDRVIREMSKRAYPQMCIDYYLGKERWAGEPVPSFTTLTVETR